MKRNIALIMAAVLGMGVVIPSAPAMASYAATSPAVKTEGSVLQAGYRAAEAVTTAVSNSENPSNTFDYATIGDLIRANNPTVKKLGNAKTKLELTDIRLADVQDDLEDAIDELDSLADNLRGVPGAGSAVFALVGNKSTLLTQLESAKDQKEDLKITKDKMIVQIEMTEDQLIASAEKLIIGYNGTETQQKKMVENKAILDRNLKKLKIYKKLGMATTNDVNKVQLSIKTLEYNSKTLDTQKANIVKQLNLMIGEPGDDAATVVLDPKLVSGIDLAGIKKEEDHAAAMTNNRNIKVQTYEIAQSEAALKRASAESFSYTVIASARLDVEDAKLKYDDIVRDEEFKFNKAYEAVLDKQDSLNVQLSTLSTEKVNLDIAKLKYKVGLISKMALDDAKAAYKLQQTSVAVARIDLFTAYRSYQWMIQGISS